jgi:ABC-2 type transport system permease protein
MAFFSTPELEWLYSGVTKTNPSNRPMATGGAAPVWRAILAMTAMELRLALRRGETLVATAVLPVVVLLFFSSVSIVAVDAVRAVDFLLPGSIAFAVIATSLVSLGITTAYDRFYGVLKRLGGSPLSRAELIAAKILAVLVVETVQVALLVGAAALVLGWQAPPGASVGLLVVAVLLGTLALAGLGLLLAGTLRAETMLAVANILFVASLVLGGVVLPIDHLPGPLATLAAALPAAALSEAMRVALGASGDAAGSLVLLAGWGLATVALAAATFRWE